MRYMEVSGNDQDSGLCSDNSCDCGYPGAIIPRGEGYVYISKEVADFRADCLSESVLIEKIQKISKNMGSYICADSGVFEPILMCEQGAKMRKLNLVVATADAKHWWKTGLVPLRSTPQIL